MFPCGAVYRNYKCRTVLDLVIANSNTVLFYSKTGIKNQGGQYEKTLCNKLTKVLEDISYEQLLEVMEVPADESMGDFAIQIEVVGGYCNLTD